MSEPHSCRVRTAALLDVDRHWLRKIRRERLHYGPNVHRPILIHDCCLFCRRKTQIRPGANGSEGGRGNRNRTAR
jgi:hypothetical protein